MTINIIEMCWDADIQDVVYRLKTHATDQDYFLATVSLVEDGFDPHTRASLTLSGLKAWEDRCLTQPTDPLETSPHAPRHRRTISPVAG